MNSIESEPNGKIDWVVEMIIAFIIGYIVGIITLNSYTKQNTTVENWHKIYG